MAHTGNKWKKETHQKEKEAKFLNYDLKIFAIFKKKRSPYIYVFQVSELDESPKGEEWFIDVLKIKTKTLEIVDKSMIIRKDMDIWLNSIKRLGFEQSETI